MSTNPSTAVSLQVIVNQEIVFQSNGKWLYPIFDLEDHLQNNPVNMAEAMIRDKVIGKAAALLLIRLDPKSIHGDVMSDLAIDVLMQFDCLFSYDKRVARIDCETEEILMPVNDPEAAHKILCKRAKRC